MTTNTPGAASASCNVMAAHDVDVMLLEARRTRVSSRAPPGCGWPGRAFAELCRRA
jgi:hypothetical protein